MLDDAEPSPGSGRVPTPEQRAAINHDGGNVYVGAGPGTGKTFVLVERMRTLLSRGVAPAQILVLTFSRRAVHELRERIAADGLPTGVEVRTFHGFAARAAGAGLARFRETRLLDSFSRRLVLEQAILRTPTPTLATSARESRAFADECARVLGDLDRVDAAALTRIAAGASPRLHDLLAIREEDARARRLAGAGDLGDIVRQAVANGTKAGSPVQTWLAGRYAHVLVDEFQDTDREQLALLGLFGAQLFAVGDEAQSIYRFRGASDAIVPYALERFAMQRYDLTESRRCPAPVCELASQTPLAALMPLRSAHTNDAAPVTVRRYGGTDDEVIGLADDIEGEIDAGRSPREIAVLLRAFRPIGPLLVDELARRGIAVASTGRAAFLADARVAVLRSALALFAEPKSGERWADLLAAPPLGLDALAIRFARNLGTTLRLDERLGASLAAVSPADSARAEQIAAGLMLAYDAWRAGDLGRAARILVRRLELLASILRDEAPIDVRAAGQRLKRICDGFASAQRTATAVGAHADPADVIARFDDILEALAQDDSGVASDVPGVRVLTIHAAKGLEFERVYIADAVQGRFPRASRATSLLDDADRTLLAANGVDGLTVAPDGAAREDASLWYVAVTRCSEELTITFSERSADGSLQRPSAFLGARIPEQTETIDRTSLLLRSLTTDDADLRARLNAVIEAEGVPALVAYARDGDAAFTLCDTGGVHSTRSFSVSDATTWLTCPRKVYYGKILGLRDEPTTTMYLGTLIHRVLQQFHERHTDFLSGTPPVEDMIAELHALRARCWDPEQFASATIADAAVRSADVALAAYARALVTYAAAHPFTVESRESNVLIAAGGYQIKGRLDRRDRLANGTAVVVDYKRGTAKPSPTKSAEKIWDAWQAADAADEPRAPLIGNVAKDVDLQLALYATTLDAAAAVVKIYLGGDADTPKRNGTAAVDFTPFDAPLASVARGALEELAREALEPLAAGTLERVATAANEEACEFCSFVRICPGPADEGAA